MEQDAPGVYSDRVGFSGDWRDSWHHQDYLALMARRWRLGRVGRALDVGCGVGHWGLRWLPFLADDATLVGVDREPAFFAEARERAASRGLAERVAFEQADASALPFPDDSFELVTCQTVLMHVADPAAVLAEMVRVLAPGGLLAVAEPHNVASTLLEHYEKPDLPIDELLDLVRLQATVERGKRALGQGDSSIASRLPRLLVDAGLVDLGLWQSDRCALLVPPYSPTEQTDIDMRLSWVEGGAAAGGTHNDARDRFVAGGGDEAEFERLWALQMAHDAHAAEAMRNATFCSPGLHVLALASGRKPS